MMRFVLYIGLLLGILGADDFSLKTPQEAVKSYYYAMNNANIELLEKVMVKSSFDMTIQTWALSEALTDKTFAQTLKLYGTSTEADQKIKDVVKAKLKNSVPKTISNLVATPLGKSRCMIRYQEDAKAKQLFTSLHEDDWKIDYLAGRKVD